MLVNGIDISPKSPFVKRGLGSASQKKKEHYIAKIVKQNYFALLVNRINIFPKYPFEKGTWFCFAEKKRNTTLQKL